MTTTATALAWMNDRIHGADRWIDDLRRTIDGHPTDTYLERARAEDETRKNPL